MMPYALTIQVATTLLIAIRVFSRFKRIGGKAGVDDGLIVFAWITGAGVTGCCIYGEPKKTNFFSMRRATLILVTR
jgi:hypothetical protein